MSFELQGKYGKANVFTDNIDEVTIGQVITFLNEDFTKDVRVAIMPDTHAGKGAVIGTTMEIKDKLVPNLVGSDIGCGVLCVEVSVEGKLNFDELDKVITKRIPLGAKIHEKSVSAVKSVPLEDMFTFRSVRDLSKHWQGLGSAGSGNHFIELSKSEDGRFFLSIHTGSRSVGTAVCKYHQKKAVKELLFKKNKEAVAEIKAKYPVNEWETKIQQLSPVVINNDLAALEGESLGHYLHDLQIAQKFAAENRKVIASEIIKGMGWKEVDQFDSIHNYVDVDNMILRKGAISAQKGEKVIVPINMRDGSIIAIGKGNPEWNYSAPHGAGRLLSRSTAKRTLSVEEFRSEMVNVHSSTVGEGTLDEAPAAYKSMAEIIENTKDTMDIEMIIRPIYNIKGN